MARNEKTWVEISKSALLHNLRVLKGHVRPSGVMGVVKANAYGHGMHETASVIKNEVAWFGVDSMREAGALRKSDIRGPILIFGYVPPDLLKECAKLDCSFVAYSRDMLTAIKRQKAKRGVYKIHLKIETGTTRQGLEGPELIRFAKEASHIPFVAIEGAYTHYANIEDTVDPSYAMNQLKRFRAQIKALERAGIRPSVIHTSSSAAAILYPETRFNLVRLGIALYGHWSSRETQVVARRQNALLNLKPALSWKTVIAQVKNVKRGTPVSYGLTERVSRASKVAVLPVGYWDGLDRGLSSVGSVLVRGRKCKILGRVCMNMVMADVTDARGARVGDEVVIIGRQGKEVISAEEIASKIDTIQYEFLTRINPLISRIIVP